MVDISSKRILMVEDVPTLQASYKKILKSYRPNLILDIANNGEEAIEKVKDFPKYNAIIMDIELPLMNGVEASKRIRKLGYKGTILVHTTIFEEDARAAVVEGGMNGFVLKQLGGDRLIAYLETYNLI